MIFKSLFIIVFGSCIINTIYFSFRIFKIRSKKIGRVFGDTGLSGEADRNLIHKFRHYIVIGIIVTIVLMIALFFIKGTTSIFGANEPLKK
jgi:hypothetical protein